MGNFLKGIEYPLFAGIFALAGLICVSPIIALLAIWFPALWPWVFAPAAAGAVIGLIFSGFVK